MPYVLETFIHGGRTRYGCNTETELEEVKRHLEKVAQSKRSPYDAPPRPRSEPSGIHHAKPAPLYTDRPLTPEEAGRELDSRTRSYMDAYQMKLDDYWRAFKTVAKMEENAGLFRAYSDRSGQ